MYWQRSNVHGLVALCGSVLNDKNVTFYLDIFQDLAQHLADTKVLEIFEE